MSLRSLLGVSLALVALLGAPAEAQNLTVNNQTITLGGVRTYDTVTLTNNARILVPAYNGSDKVGTGNLQIRANSITIDATSSIVADGRGYQPKLCDHGPGPNPTAGGRGGCAVLDSGGGGAHFGGGGRGTKDCFCYGSTTTCTFPQEFEETCGSLNAAGNGCIQDPPGATVPGTCQTTPATCYNNDGIPSVAGIKYWHSIYLPEFGAAGGDKGCRDGWDTCNVAGAGGGRIVLAAVNDAKTGVLSIQGQVSASGYRGCGHGNDSGGGGAGGTVVLVGDTVTVGAAAKVRAAGALGGDTNANQPGSTCPACAQAPGGTCDDCGGGGGGGLISVLARSPASLATTAVFDVRGADGGTCTICKGEAGGAAGELQLNGVYVGEFCDGYDNDFDGLTDETLGNTSCGTGACQQTLPLCITSGVGVGTPNDCVPLSLPTCQAPLTDSRPRFLVILDSSGSMLTDLNAAFTFGDGSAGHLGLDTNGDGVKGNDSRLYKAKVALTNVLSAYPEIDFGLARYAQGVGPNVNCQLAHWFECANLCCTYDDPTNNGTSPPQVCSVTAGSAGTVPVYMPASAGEACINYAGSCGSPKRGADILVGFGKSLNQTLMWLDHKETNFLATTAEGDHCAGGDCELRGTGPTPLADSLLAAKAYLAKIKASDSVASCRKYAIILLTDGAETCQGNPTTAAAALLSQLNVETFVVGFSVLASEQASLNGIANAGSTAGNRPAYFAANETELAAAVASIVSKSVLFEKCNGLDDNCNNQCDENWPEVAVTGAICTNKHAAKPCTVGVGICERQGVYQCKADGSGSVCSVVPGPPNPGGEICGNGLDDNCNGAIDEGCPPCVPQPEICDGKDNDCDTQIDEGYLPQPCGSSIGECEAGLTACVGGKVVCQGGVPPVAELCDGKDNNCDTVIDGFGEPCYPPATGCDLATGVCKGICALGTRLCTGGVWGTCAGWNGPAVEKCNGLDDDCDGIVDNNLADIGAACGVNKGECKAGVKACVQDPVSGVWSLICQGEVPGTAEVCDGKDNDCDDLIDEDFPEKGKLCGKNVGECKGGTWVCENNGLVCQGEVGPTPEICDAKDNDCNGAIDDNVPGEGQPCGDSVGECKAGVTKCLAGKFICVGGTGPQTEICDGKDNNCDGKTDENAECPGTSVCIEGSCVVPCAGQEFACPGGTKCVNGYCISDKCSSVKCKPTERCVNGACVEKCSGVTCQAYEKCEPTTGLCVDDSCMSKGCPAGERCVGYQCVKDPCPPGLCPQGQMCLDGKCYDTCVNVSCPTGEVCSQGKCVKNPCENYPCDSNYVCKVVNGLPRCEVDPCRIITCKAGEVCWDGSCVPNPCAAARCPAGFECKLNSLGGADCKPSGELPVTTQIVAAGGGGCACSLEGDADVGGLLAPLLGLLWLWRRRRIARGGAR
jgi:MYXO-CTERM domain-containing protein